MDDSELYDAIVIGGGPAGMTAAMYLARAKYKVAIIEKLVAGGQIRTTSEVANYPGTGRITGIKLTDEMEQQCREFGVIFISDEALSMDIDNEIKTVKSKLREYRTLAIIIATGTRPRKIGFEGEVAFEGRGISYCATCDGRLYEGKSVFVIGGGYTAAEEGVYLARYARKVTMLIREDEFTCAAKVADKAIDNPKIEIHFNTQVERVDGKEVVNSITYVDDKTGMKTTYYEKNGNIGVFVFAGYEAATSLARDKVEVSKQNYIMTDEDGRTSVEGIFAAGDVRCKTLRQVTTAVGDGANVAATVEKYLKEKSK